MNSFSAGLVALVVVFVAAVSVAVYIRTNELIDDGLVWQGRAYVDLVVDVRAWSARHHGVFVLERPLTMHRIQSDGLTLVSLASGTEALPGTRAADPGEAPEEEIAEPQDEEAAEAPQEEAAATPEADATHAPEPEVSETPEADATQTPGPDETGRPDADDGDAGTGGDASPGAGSDASPGAGGSPADGVVPFPGSDEPPGGFVPPTAAATPQRDYRWLSPYEVLAQLAGTSKRSGGVTFHLTSLDPIDPGNAPDAWERAALLRFRQGEKEAWERVTIDGKQRFRYMAPVYTLASCRTCHVNTPYKVGSVRGAVSVTMPVAAVDRERSVNVALIVLLAAATLAAALAVLWVLVFRVRRRLRQTQTALAHMALHDELTGAANRRQSMDRLAEELARAGRSGAPLSVLILDLDHFKGINDVNGHLFGDLVLRETVRRVSATSRAYDVVGRVGGEEFLVIAPETSIDEAAALAERIRVAVGGEPMTDGEISVVATVSVGVAQSRGETEVDELVARADAGLYRAKEGGRDRVVVDGAAEPDS